jgi:hypothetical protein
MFFNLFMNVDIRRQIRKIFLEQEELRPGLKEYLDSMWLTDHYDDILSILEGNPNPAAIIDIENQMKFDDNSVNIKGVSLKDGMTLYFKENSLPQYEHHSSLKGNY